MRTRPAFTLMEIMVVVAILVIVTAISIPLVRTMLDDGHLAAAGDMIRGQVAETRSRALESGRPWRLAYIANTGFFQLAPEDASDWDNTATDPVRKENLIRDQLPPDIVFAINRDDILGAQQAGTPGQSWQTIGIYTFDGGARDDSTTYFGKPGLMPMRVRLRGLTGTVAVDSAADVKADQP